MAINICSYKYKRNVEVLAPTAGTIVLNLFIYWLQGQNRGRGHRYHAVCVCIFVCLWTVCLHRRMLSWVNKWHIDSTIEFLSGNAVLPDVKSVCFQSLQNVPNGNKFYTFCQVLLGLVKQRVINISTILSF